MNDLSEIKDRVKNSVHLAEFITREGVPMKGGPVEWKALCPFHPEKTPSFSVNSQEGFFCCFGCQAKGDVFEFVMRRKGLDFMNALKYVANGVGVSVPEKRIYQPNNVRAAGATAKPRGPFDPDQYRAITPGGKVWTYLTEQRKLTEAMLTKYRVGETADGEAYAFAYNWWPPGMPREEGRKPRFEFCKVVKVDRENGKKIERRDPSGGKNILFGMCAVPDDATELIICEGEIDAITWAQFGFNSVSVPGGAGYTGWIEICWDWLERFKKIHISFDEDAAGRRKLLEVVQRLGIARTDIIRLPEKGDA
jgi:DNA primase